MDGMSHLFLTLLFKSISIISKFSPTPWGNFDVHTLYNISLSCDILPNPILYRAIFLTAFYGFLRMSNFAPHSSAKFSQDHFLKQDLISAPPGDHLLVKWTKTLQHHKSHCKRSSFHHSRIIFGAQLGPSKLKLPRGPCLHLLHYSSLIHIFGMLSEKWEFIEI